MWLILRQVNRQPPQAVMTQTEPAVSPGRYLRPMAVRFYVANRRGLSVISLQIGIVIASIYLVIIRHKTSRRFRNYA